MKTRAAHWRRLQHLCALAMLMAISATESFAQTAGKVFTLGGTTLSLEEATTDLGVYYTSMRFNRAANTWNVEVSLTNRSSQTWLGPMVLLVESFSGTSGPLQPDGADEAAKPFYELSSLVLDGELVPQETSLRRTLSIAFQTNAAPQLTVRVFARRPQSLAGLQVVRTLDDAGLPLPSVTVDSPGAAGGTAQTDDAFGLATLTQTNATRVLRFSAPGFQPVWRIANLTSNGVGVIPHPRLTRRDANPASLTPIGGGELTRGNPAVQVKFTPGAFSQDTAAVLTRLTGQTLPLFLPPGWSPLAAFWLELSSEPALPGNGTLTPSGPIPPSETAAFVKLNTNSLTWEVLQLVAGNGSNAVNVALPGSGAFALVVADAAPIAPPNPTVSVSLPPSATPLPDAASLRAGGTVTPTTSPASKIPELVTATAEVLVTNLAGNLPSGTLLRGEVSERYTLRDGTRRFPALFDNFVVGYQRPGDTRLDTVRAEFPIRPLLLFGADELQEALVHMNLFAPGAFSGGILGTNGGQVASEGLRVLAGLGDLLAQQAVQLKRLNVTNFTELAGSNATVVAAFELGVNGVAAGRKLIVQLTGLATNSTFVLARVLAREGLYGLEPRERLHSDGGGNLVSDEPASGEKLPGLNGAGQYVLLKISPTQGLVSGIAKNSSGQPAGGLPVRIAAQPWLTFSANDGAFKLLAPAGDATVTVTDLATGDSGAQIVNIPNPQTPVNTQLASVSSGPRVASVTPTNNATLVPRVTSVIVEFDKPLNPATLAAGGIALLDASNATVSASLTLNLRGTVATLLPVSPLAANARHTIALSTNLADLTGRKLEGPTVFPFTTENDPLNRPAADLVIYEPTNGLARMTGGPGMAEPNAPVILVNESSGATATVLSKLDGSFDNFMSADPDDELSAVIVNGNGTRNTVLPSRQIFRDGSVRLFESGGVIEATTEHGLMQFAVDPGAIAGRVKYKLQPVSAAQVTALLTNVPLEAETKLLGGFVLSQEGSDPVAGPHVSFPIDPATLGLPAGARPEDASFVLAIPVETDDGSIVFHVVDRMYFTNGALRTFSPPFKGSILKFFIDNLRSSKKLSPATKILNLLGLPSLQDVVIHQLMLPMMIAQGTSQTIFGATVSVQADSSGGIVSGSQRAVAGAVISVTRDDQSSGRPGRLRPGGMFTTSDGAGRYALAVPANKLEQPGFVGSAIHPAFPFQRPSVGTVLGSLAAQLRTTSVGAQMDFFFQRVSVPNAPGPDETPPTIRIAVEPRDPLPGTNVNEGATLTVSGIDDQSLASLDLIVENFDPFGSFTNPPQPVLLQIQGSQFVIGPAAVQQSYRLTSELRGHVRLVATASDNAGHLREMKTVVSIAGDRIFSGNTNDTVGPRVLFTLPPDGAQGLSPGSPVIVQFSEPVDAALMTNPAPWLTLAAGSLSSVQLSSDGRTLSIFFTPQSVSPVNFTINSQLTDVNTNAFDQLPGQSGSQSYTWAVTVLAPNVGNLVEITSGGGVVTKGRYAFALERQQNAGAVFIYDLSGTAPSKVAEISLVGPARDLALIPNYSFKMKASDNCHTADLLAVVGGSISADSPFQYLRIFDVTDPANPIRIAGSSISLNIAAITKVQWAPPWILYLESGADITDVGVVDLQSYIIGMNATPSEIAQFPANGQAGLDVNGDGDYCDTVLNEITPLPIRSPTEFFGKEFSVLGDGPETNTTRRILDFDFDPESGLFGITVSGGAVRDINGQPTGPVLPPYYRTVATRSAQLDPAQSTLVLPFGVRPKRVAIFSGVRLLTTTNVTFRNLAIISLADVNPPRLAIVDISNPLQPALLGDIPLVGFGIPQTLQRRDDGLLAISTSTDVLLFDPAKLLLPASPGGNLPAFVGNIQGAGAGANSFAAGADGVNAVNLGSKHQVQFAAPTLRIVAFPNRAPLALSDVLSFSDEQKFNLLASAELRTRLLRTRFFDSSTNQTLLPPSTNTHYYVRVDMLGSLGAELELVLEGLNGAGQPLRSSGSNRPPARLASTQVLQQLGETNGSLFPTFLRAKRLSPAPGSPLYNVYLAGPITLAGRSFSSAQVSSIQSQLPRTIVSAGRALWVGLDASLNAAPYPAGIRSAVAQQRLVPGASVYAQVDSPPLPVILVPGVAGSHLSLTVTLPLLGNIANMGLWPGFTDVGKSLLTLNPADTQFTILAPDIVRIAPEPYEYPSRFSSIACFAAPIYEPLLEFLTGPVGLREYDYLKPSSGILSFLPCPLGSSQTVATPQDSVTNRTVSGADYPQIDLQPNLFVFPYDWRRSNVPAVAQLKEYVEVVKRFHPEAEQVNIVAHSMGGLVARRFILDNPGAVNKLITLGSPWLGAPKAINALETGDFLDFIQHVLVIKKSTLKVLAEFFLGPQELVPSPADFSLAGSPFVDLAGDFPGSVPGVGGGALSFPQFQKVMDEVYHTNVLVAPASVSTNFHDYAVPGVGKQDDWSTDNTGVEYFHILGIQSAPNTIGKIISRLRIRPTTQDPVNLFEIKREFSIEYTRGDGTVPVFSSLRINGSQNLNAPNAHIYQLFSPGPGGDKLTDHNGMLANPELLDLVGRILDGDIPPTNAPTAAGIVTYVVRVVNAEKNELTASVLGNPAINSASTNEHGSILYGLFDTLFVSREEEVPGLQIEEPATNIVDAVLRGSFNISAGYDGRPISLRVEEQVDGVPQTVYIWHSLDPSDFPSNAPSDFEAIVTINSPPVVTVKAGGNAVLLPPDEVGPANPPPPTLSYQYTNNCRAIVFTIQGALNTNITELYIGGPPANTNDAEVLHYFTNNVIPLTNLLAIAVSNRIDVFAQAGEIPSAALTIDIVGIDLTLDAAGTKPLSDWPAAAQKPRSAKRLFNQDDQVFIKVKSQANLGDNHFRVHVYSESDTNGIFVKLQEVNSGEYQNLLASEVLKFEQFDPNSPGAAVGIKDEELVTFELMDPHGIHIADCDLMVDLGEISIATLEHLDRSDAAKPRFDFQNRFLVAGDGFLWSSAGVRLDFPDNVAAPGSGTNNAMGRAIISFADPALTDVGQADFLYIHAHGDQNGNLSDHVCNILTNLPCSEIISPQQTRPPLHEVWNKDADFLLLDACLTLNEGLGATNQPISGTPGRDAWVRNMGLSSRPLHGILGFFLPKTPRLRVEYVDFMMRLQGGAAIPDAFQAAMEASAQGRLPWAYLWYESQLGDTIQVLNQDEVGNAAIRYRNTRGTQTTFICEDQATPARPSNVEGRVFVGGNTLARQIPLPALPESLTVEAEAPPLLAKALTLGQHRLRAGRHEFEPDLSQAPMHNLVPTIENAKVIAWAYLVQNGYSDQNLRLVDTGEVRSQLITNVMAIAPQSELEAYVVTYVQLIAGLPVDRSCLRVEVAQNRVRRMTRDGFINEAVVPAAVSAPALGAVNAVARSAAQLNSIFPQLDQVVVTDAELVWTSEEPILDLLLQNKKPAKLIPAWRCVVRSGTGAELREQVMIHAQTGAVLEGER